MTDYLVDPSKVTPNQMVEIDHQVALHQIIVKGVVVVISTGASVSKSIRGRVKPSSLMILLNFISFGIFVRFSH